MNPRRAPQPDIQILRGLAALAVAVSHLPVDFYVAGLPWDVPHLDAGVFGVDLFFVISGFIMVYVAEEGRGVSVAGRFLLRRLVRIVPLYWLFTTAMLLVNLHELRHQGLGTYLWKATGLSYLFFPFPEAPGGDIYPIYSVGWTLNYEMFFYICFAAALMLPRRRRYQVLGGALTALVVLGSLVRLPLPFAFWTRSNVLEFVFGMAIAGAVLRGVELPLGARLGCLLAGIAGAVAFQPFSDSRDALRGLGWGMPAALIVAAAVLRRPGPLPRGGTPLLVLGNASYSLYLLHPLAFRGFFALLEPALRRGAISSPAAMATMLAATVAGALVLYRVLEAPMTRALQGLAGRPRATTERLSLDTIPP